MMSILRYEKPPTSHLVPEPATPGEACCYLLALLAGAVLTAAVGGVVVFSSPGWLFHVVLWGLLLLPLMLLLATQVLVVQPMWQRCRRHDSVGAAIVLGLGTLVSLSALLVQLVALDALFTPW